MLTDRHVCVSDGGYVVCHLLDSSPGGHPGNGLKMREITDLIGFLSTHDRKLEGAEGRRAVGGKTVEESL